MAQSIGLVLLTQGDPQQPAYIFIASPLKPGTAAHKGTMHIVIQIPACAGTSMFAHMRESLMTRYTETVSCIHMFAQVREHIKIFSPKFPSQIYNGQFKPSKLI